MTIKLFPLNDTAGKNILLSSPLMERITGWGRSCRLFKAETHSVFQKLVLKQPLRTQIFFIEASALSCSSVAGPWVKWLTVPQAEQTPCSEGNVPGNGQLVNFPPRLRDYSHQGPALRQTPTARPQLAWILIFYPQFLQCRRYRTCCCRRCYF